MATNRSPTFYRLNSVDRHGRHIDAAVLAAAEEIFPRALDYGLTVLGDSAVVANVLEESAAKVSRLLKSKDPPGQPAPIQDLASYIFRAFLRDVNRLRRKQLVLVSSPDEDLESLRRTDPSRQILIKILADEFLARCDPMTQDMFGLRMQGFTWEEIGRNLGISAHAAEKRFSQTLRRALARLKIIKTTK
jgi:DNA-directed RNA polymerase specialized sigma24 family protein